MHRSLGLSNTNPFEMNKREWSKEESNFDL
jgi:hypothetical protein